MTKLIELTLDIGATFNPAITLDSSQTGRTHRAHIRETVASTSVMIAFSTGSGITLVGDTVTLYAGADVTELLNLATDAAHWVIDIESVGATAADVRREARGIVIVSRDVTRTTEATPAPSALGLVAYSEPQTLTEPQKTQARDNIGAGTGGGSSDAVLYTAQSLSGPQKTQALTNQGVTASGRALAQAADASAQRTALSLGTLAIQSGTFSGTSSGTNTGDQTSIFGLTGTKAQFDAAVTDGNIQFVGDAPTAHTHLLAAGATDVSISAANLNTLDDGVNTALHFHDADRARGNHTGTQALSTLSQSGATTSQVPTWNGTAWAPATPSSGGGMAIGANVAGAANNRLFQSGATGLLEQETQWYFGDLTLPGMPATKTLRTALPYGGFIAEAYNGSGLFFGRIDSGVGLFVGEYNGSGPVIPVGCALRFGYTTSDYRPSDIAIYRNSATELKIADNTGTGLLNLSLQAIKLSVFTVATLPSPSLGLNAKVSDALTPTYAAQVVGGGAVTVNVEWDVTANFWRCG